MGWQEDELRKRDSLNKEKIKREKMIENEHNAQLNKVSQFFQKLCIYNAELNPKIKLEAAPKWAPEILFLGNDPRDVLVTLRSKSADLFVGPGQFRIFFDLEKDRLLGVHERTTKAFGDPHKIQDVFYHINDMSVEVIISNLITQTPVHKGLIHWKTVTKERLQWWF